MPSITQTEILDLMRSGKPVCEVEYRGFTADRMRWVNKKSGKQMEAGIIKHRVETSSEGFVVSEFLDDGVDEKKYKNEFKKGDRVVLVVETLKRETGSLSASGELFALEVSTAKPASGAKV